MQKNDKNSQYEVPMDDIAGANQRKAVRPAMVTPDPTAAKPPAEQSLWAAIRNRTQAIGFNRYNKFINTLFFGGNSDKYDLLISNEKEPQNGETELKHRFNEPRGSHLKRGINSYNLLKLATEAFLICECGLVFKPGDDVLNPQLFEFDAKGHRLGQADISAKYIKIRLQKILGNSCNISILPYLDDIIDQIMVQNKNKKKEIISYYETILRFRLTYPSMIELIWSYWHEEGMLAQTLNAIALRLQNKRSSAQNPLTNLKLDHLRPLNHLLWGFLQDEISRSSVHRRAYAYHQHYGFSLAGKHVLRSPSIDSPSKFPGSFQNLLYHTALFYRQDDDNTTGSTAGSLLNALREVHTSLAEGAHNQYGDLPWTTRREMLIMRWLLARKETKKFLRGRTMVPFQESWMDEGNDMDMKRLEHLGDVHVTHFHQLANFGERILLSIRFGGWSDIDDQEIVQNWARYWRPEIQGYIHAYNAATGVDLAANGH